MKSFFDHQADIYGQFELLLHIEPTGRNFLTCSLDADGSRRMSQNVFRKMQIECLKTIDDRQQRVDFNNAAKMVELYLESLDSNVKSIMIYSRGIIGGQFFLAIPVSSPIGNDIYFQSTPALKKLHEIIKNSSVGRNGNWNFDLHWEEDSRVHHHDLLLQKHIETDENSYDLACGKSEWLKGSPVMLRKKIQMDGKSFDRVA